MLFSLPYLACLPFNGKTLTRAAFCHHFRNLDKQWVNALARLRSMVRTESPSTSAASLWVFPSIRTNRKIFRVLGGNSFSAFATASSSCLAASDPSISVSTLAPSFLQLARSLAPRSLRFCLRAQSVTALAAAEKR